MSSHTPNLFFLVMCAKHQLEADYAIEQRNQWSSGTGHELLNFAVHDKIGGRDARVRAMTNEWCDLKATALWFKHRDLPPPQRLQFIMQKQFAIEHDFELA